jgi:ABC-type Mn2+/Zn2+ transport system ATPase subunit
MFARLLLQDADLILLDEPFTALDAKTAADLLAVVQRWHGEGRTVLAVLHDIEAVRRHFPETLLLAREKVAHGQKQARANAQAQTKSVSKRYCCVRCARQPSLSISLSLSRARARALSQRARTHLAEHVRREQLVGRSQHARVE